jgi:hypothetical protein
MRHQSLAVLRTGSITKERGDNHFHLSEAALDTVSCNSLADTDSSQRDGGSSDKMESRGGAANSANAASFLRLTHAAHESDIDDSECPPARGESIFVALYRGGASLSTPTWDWKLSRWPSGVL